MTQSQKGTLFVVIGAIGFSAKAIFIKLAYQNYTVDDITLLTLRFGFALPFFLIVAIWRTRIGQFKHIEIADWLKIAIISILGYYLASWFDFTGLQYISAGIERVILFIYPTLVILFSKLFFNKKITKTTLWAVIITYIGIAIIALDTKTLTSSDFIKGAGYVLASSVTYALFLVFGGEEIKKHGSINFNTISLICSSVYVLIHFNVFSKIELSSLPNGVLGYGLALALISTFIPTFFMAEGIKLMDVNRSAIVSSLGPVSTIILAYIFLNETLSFQEIIGSICVIIGVMMIGK